MLQRRRLLQTVVLGLMLVAFVGVQPRSALATPVSTNKNDNVYTVRLGETLVEVAYRFDTNLATLRALNNLEEDELIWSGRKLTVPPETGLVAYTVQQGDTLHALASKFRTPLVKLVEYNHVSPSQRLIPGMQFLVPAAEENLLASELPVHTVQSGENLGTIAEQYDTSAQGIARINNLDAPNDWRPGQKLVIPPMSLHERMGQAPKGEDGYHQLALKDFPTFTEKWIDVDLSEQRVVAYEGMRPVESFVISSGRNGTPTVTGVFRIWAKVPAQRMTGGSRAAGDYYDLPGVPWVQYFYQDYSFHGTYWHNSFGRPMSHGCINMRSPEARWLYEWASPTNEGGGWVITEKDTDTEGTLVIVHL